MFIDLSDGRWDPDPPDIDDAEKTMLAVAAGEIDEPALTEWLRDRVRFGCGDPADQPCASCTTIPPVSGRPPRCFGRRAGAAAALSAFR